MKGLRDKFTTMDVIGLGGILMVLVLGMIFIAKEWGFM